MRSSSEAAGAFIGGWRRVIGAPAIVAGAWVTSAVVGLPFAMMVRDAIEGQLGYSQMAAAVAAGVVPRWWLEFASQATGVAATLTPQVIGFAAVLANLSGVADGRGVPNPLLAPVAGYLLAWIFLAGGILDRYARGRRLGSHAFFGACGRFFVRFLRLTVVTGLGYALVGAFWWVLLARLFPWLTRDLTSERVAFAWLLALYGLGLIPLVLVNVTADYARIRAVVEDRRSVIGAVIAAVRFIARHPVQVAALYALNTGAFVLVVASYAVVAPGGQGGAGRWLAVLAIGQAYVVARLAARLAFLATGVSLFQRTLAHAGYTAPPVPIWPESPSAEAIENAARLGVRPGP
jgi:hypothetical protein